jgi:hypothetical protein
MLGKVIEIKSFLYFKHLVIIFVSKQNNQENLVGLSKTLNNYTSKKTNSPVFYYYYLSN